MILTQKITTMQDIRKAFIASPLASLYISLFRFKEVNDDKMYMRQVVDDNTDIVTLEYNPNTIRNLTIDEGRFLLAGEMFRLALGHTTSRQTIDRGKSLTASNYLVYNRDINHFIGTKNTLDPLVDFLTSKNSYDSLKDALDIDKEDAFFENIIMKLSEIEPPPPPGGGGGDSTPGGGGGEPSPVGGGGEPTGGEPSPGGGGGENETDSDVDGQDGAKKGEGDSEGGDSSNSYGTGAGKEDIAEKIKRVTNPDNTKGWGESQQSSQKVSEANRKAAARGLLSGPLEKILLNQFKSKFNPSSIIKRFVGRTRSEKIRLTRSKPNRRHGLLLPAQVKKINDPKILFAIDASGSMSPEDVNFGIGVMKTFMKQCALSYCFWDAACTDIKPLKTTAKSIEGVGGGGTDPQVVIDKIKAEKLNFDGIVYFTDCYFSWSRPKEANKIFVITNGGEPPEWVRHKLNFDTIVDYFKK